MKVSYELSIFYIILAVVFCYSIAMYAGYNNQILAHNKQHNKQHSEQQNKQQKIKQATPTEEKIEHKERFFSQKTLKKHFSTEKSIFYIILLAFLLGILASFTPCIYPMIPITLGILQVQASASLLHNFFLSLSYVFGISIVYAALGYLAATTTLLFGQWLTNPWLIGFVILIFIWLAFSMFGFYEIQMPAFLTRRMNLKVKGSLVYSFLFGMLSGTVASPCLTPALAILLSFVAKAGNPLFGFLILWSFAFGMGLLLIVIGTFSTTITFLPRSGMWMVEIKKFFGFMILATCVYFLQSFFAFHVLLKMYAIVCLLAAVYYLITAKKSVIKIVFGILLAILCVVLLSWGMSKQPKTIHKYINVNLKS